MASNIVAPLCSSTEWLVHSVLGGGAATPHAPGPAPDAGSKVPPSGLRSGVEAARPGRRIGAAAPPPPLAATASFAKTTPDQRHEGAEGDNKSKHELW